jgi:hypothetical protein
MCNVNDNVGLPHFLDLELDTVTGGKNSIINFGGGYSWVFQTRDNGSLSAMWVCTPQQCIDVTPHH